MTLFQIWAAAILSVYLKWLVYIWDTAVIELNKSLGTSGATLYSTFIVIVS